MSPNKIKRRSVKRRSNRKIKSRKSKCGSKVAKKSNPKLWESVVKKVKKGSKGGPPNKWSARKSQLAVKEYKRMLTIAFHCSTELTWKADSTMFV